MIKSMMLLTLVSSSLAASTCDVSKCTEWSCAEWCACYDDALLAAYANNGESPRGVHIFHRT